MPKVSVVIPTYNRAKLLKRAIRSVLNQTYQNFEIVVVNDGSTDNTEEVVKKFQKQDERIRYIWYKENKGEAAARNTGIKAARGKYIASQDNDDEWLPEKLKKQIKAFQNASPKVGVVYTGFWKLQGDKKIYIPSSAIAQKEGNIYNSLLKINFIGTPATLIRKECFERVGMFNERLRNFVDWEMWLRISKHYYFKYIKESLVNAYYGCGNVSYNNETAVAALEFIFKEHFEDIKKNRKLLIRYCSDIGHAYCLQGQTKQGRVYILQAIKAYPFSIKLLMMAFLSLFNTALYKTVVKMKESIVLQKQKISFTGVLNKIYRRLRNIKANE